MRVALPPSAASEAAGPSATPSRVELGFLLVDYLPTHGYVGALLTTTCEGFPLTFHYTRPVCPTETQRILYGALLQPYIYGRLLARELLLALKRPPVLVVTNEPLLVAERCQLGVPVVCPARNGEVSHEKLRPVEMGSLLWWIHNDFLGDFLAFQQVVREVGDSQLLLEPLDRTRQAVQQLVCSASTAKTA
jgi:hypothetical protein